METDVLYTRQMPTPTSTCAGIGWPAIPTAKSAQLLAIHHQLQESQWWPLEKLRLFQARQLEQLLLHANAHIPFYRQRFQAIPGFKKARILTGALWQRIPILTRAEVQELGDKLCTNALPEGHGPIQRASTSGSTGRPLVAHTSEAYSLLNTAFRLRSHYWHERKFDKTYADIRAIDHAPPRGGWVPAFPSGPHLFFDVRRPTNEQLDWLEAQKPSYLLTHPANLRSLLCRCQEQERALPSLSKVSTFGEVLPPDLRVLCQKVWRAPIDDVYSPVEGGTIALQCPEHQHYHVQSERVLVEVVDDDGKLSQPGEIGRVLITPLHGFAMPLIRYELGDYAEVGSPCACGRPLPVLKRILGRPRNRLLLPSGDRIWPVHPDEMAQIRSIRQFKLVQISTEEVKVEVVAAHRLDSVEQAKVQRIVADNLGHPFAVTVVQVDSIAMSRGKQEEVQGL